MKHTLLKMTAAVALSLLPVLGAQATVRYVKVGGTGDGSSWEKAAGRLQAAINASSAGDEVWVAEGTYQPDSLIKKTKKTTNAIFLKDGVSLYGGFAGNETSKDARAMKNGGKAYEFVHETVLNADDDVADSWVREIAGSTTYRYTWKQETASNGTQQVIGTKGNSTHLFYSTAVFAQPTTINGFTLRGANANVANAKPSGAAVYARGNVHVSQCRVLECSAYFSAESTGDINSYGGGVYVAGTADNKASVTDCYFARTYSHSSYGQGIGGALYASAATVSNCEFKDCVADDGGGGVAAFNSQVTGCTFTDCYASSGGAAYVGSGSTFEGNTVLGCRGLLGGGVNNAGGLLLHNVVANCYADATDYGSDLGGRGGGIYNNAGKVVGCVVYNNESFDGAGIFVKGGQVVNCTVQRNSLRVKENNDTANIGFGQESLKDQVYNTIGNADADASNFVKPTAFVGVAKSAADTAAVQAALWALAEGSQFIDKGTASDVYTETTDIAGNSRVLGESIDVGAYEYKAEAKPAIVITYGKVGASVRLGLASNEQFQIDWGDGNKSDKMSSGYKNGVVKGSTVKVYGDGIIQLIARQQNITALDVTNAPEMVQMQVGGNQIAALDVTNNTKLTGLYAEDNQIASIDVSKCSALRVLDVSNNKIAGTVDCSGMGNLSKVDCSNNNVEELKLPHHSTLYEVDCANNKLKSLDLSGLSGLDELSCHTNDITALNADDLTAMTSIYAYGNKLTSFDPSKCKSLKTLNLAENEIASIDLSKNTALTGLYLYNNKLETLDITANSELRWINVDSNAIAAINTSAQKNLSLFYAEGNKLSSVDLSSNPSITMLHLGGNQLTAIDVSRQSSLSQLKINDNKIATLDLTKNPYLYWLNCENNAIAALDLSKNSYVQWISAENNKLTALDLSNNKGVQGLTLQNNQMNADAINAVIEQLQDVSSVEITDNNSSWARKLNISYMPGTKDANVEAATAKGWNVTAIASPTAVGEVDVEVMPVSRTYYNLNGVNVGSEVTVGGVYVEKTTYSDGTTKSRKIVVKK